MQACGVDLVSISSMSYMKPFIVCRRLTLQRFPHFVIYRIEPDADFIRIVAVCDQRSRPGSWRYRVEESAPNYAVPLAA